MTWLSSINPVPGFPAYTGPHKVGSVDVEIPVSELESPSDDAPPADISTVAFRVFYPCAPDSAQKAVRWIPSPQREYMAAYARFLGANSAFASVFSLLPQLLQLTTIPVHANAAVLEPTTASRRWPVMLFSHGLGGSRNAYSHFCGSLASHGLVVVAPDHRDGSAPLSLIHGPDGNTKPRRVPYARIDHKPTPDVYAARDDQLRIRLWELGMIHAALLSLDASTPLTNVAPDAPPAVALAAFASRLAVHEPGSISIGGHSFGAATAVQFVKSVFHPAPPASNPSSSTALLTPRRTSPLAAQITPHSPVILLDLWTLPLHSPATAHLLAHPMPCYAPSGPGGPSLLAILSEGFYKWSTNLSSTLRLLAPPPSSALPGPHIFYPRASAHLSQSDFGILFPWATAKAFGAREPERVLALNTRAVVQVLRERGVEVAPTGEVGWEGGVEEGILKREGVVRGWVYVGVEGGSGGVEKTPEVPGDGK